MPGLSRWVVNGTAYFEKAGFQARISGRYRSKFLAEVSGLSLKRDLVTAKSEMVVDAQVGYTFQSGALEGLRSEEHTSELQSLMRISYAVFCLKKKKRQNKCTNKHTVQHHYKITNQR